MNDVSVRTNLFAIFAKSWQSDGVTTFFSHFAIHFVGFKSQSSHSYKPIASSRQNLNSSRTAAKRNSTLSSKMSSHGMGTRSVSSGTLNQAVSLPKSHYNSKDITYLNQFLHGC